MTVFRILILTIIASLMPLAASSATVGASNALVLLDDLGGGELEFSGIADIDTPAGPFGSDALFDFAIGFGPSVPGGASGFFDASDADELLAGIPLSIRYEGSEAIIRLALDPLSTLTGFEKGFFARIDFGAPVTSLTPGVEYEASISVAPVPLPASAAFLLLGALGLAIAGRKRG